MDEHPNPPPRPFPGSGVSSSPALRIASALVLTLLFAAPALLCIHTSGADDPDLWWHLATGQWILQHHAIPHADPFSVLSGRPWQAYSWLFEVIVTRLFNRLGLVGIVAYTSTLVFAITLAIYTMVQRLQADISVAALITAAAAYSLGHLYTPRPWLFTILFFVLELTILTHARRSGRLRPLLWLPLIFALWANLHIEYIDGLLVLCLAFTESIAARWWSAAETRLRPTATGSILLASLAATLLNPYGWHVYSVVFDYSSRLANQASALNSVSELQAMPFRDAGDFLILLLALASAAALAAKRRFVLFETALLLFAVVLSFRSQRDLWITAVVSAMILASGIVTRRKSVASSKFALPVAVAAAALLLPIAFRIRHVDNARLQASVATIYPAAAVQAIRAGGYPGPLFDDYNWGGYLIWSLHLPVTMDGRASFYGDQRIGRSLSTWNAAPDWASDPQLTSSRVVIGPAKAALTQLLRTNPHFRLIYEDKLATAFIPK
ncbi:MAG TPA: hypothetical protein VGU23_08785 [Acidobacteriaceae bacterium]|nr:hypothetical protein [Acidobacteriaceae bacterium]